MQARQFKNFTNEDFTWKFDGVEHTFPAGETIYLEDFKADHFTKHLVDKELNRLGIRTNDMGERTRLAALCTPSAPEVSPAQALNLNEVKKKSKPKKVDEFEDLKIKPKKRV